MAGPLGLEIAVNLVLEHQGRGMELFGARRARELSRLVPWQSCAREALLLARSGPHVRFLRLLRLLVDRNSAPTTGLDPITANTINHLICSLQKRLGVTSIVVTHDIHSAFAVGDRIAFLAEGKITNYRVNMKVTFVLKD